MFCASILRSLQLRTLLCINLSAHRHAALNCNDVRWKSNSRDVQESNANCSDAGSLTSKKSKGNLSSSAEYFSTFSASQTSSHLKENLDQQEAEPWRKYNVLPHRSSLTSRLWLDRFDKTNTELKKILERKSSVGGVTTPRLVLKRMKDSMVTETLPFATNPHVREEYINFFGGIRVAKVLEDMDAMAGAIAYSHCDDNTPETTPLTIVTASVDRIDLLRRPSVNEDTRLSGTFAFTRILRLIQIFVHIKCYFYLTLMVSFWNRDGNLCWTLINGNHN
jgi:hypothetical protein